MRVGHVDHARCVFARGGSLGLNGGMTIADRAAVPHALTEAEKGVMFAVMAHLVWGGMAFYFGLIRHVSPVEIAVHRGLWALPVAGFIVWYLGQYRDVRKAISSPRNLAILSLTSVLIVFNWGFYVWSIEVGRIRYSTAGLLQYISPSLVFPTAVFAFGEPLDVWKLVSFALIWLALAIFTVAAIRDERNRRMDVGPL